MTEQARRAELIDNIVGVFGEDQRERYTKCSTEELEATWKVMEKGRARARKAGGRMFGDWDDPSGLRIIKQQ